MTKNLRIAIAVGCVLAAGCDFSDEAAPAAKTPNNAVDGAGTSSDPEFAPQTLETNGATMEQKIRGIDDALLASARTALPQEISTSEIVTFLESGLWNSDRTAVAISIPRPGPEASLIFVFLRQSDGAYLAAHASGVEDGNFGKLGMAGREAYERFETTPVEWVHREDAELQVVMRTRAWKAGQRYTVSEPLVIRRDGFVSYR